MLFLICYFNYPNAWTGISCPDIFSISGANWKFNTKYYNYKLYIVITLPIPVI